jgi:hypothetical protein
MPALELMLGLGDPDVPDIGIDGLILLLLLFEN